MASATKPLRSVATDKWFFMLIYLVYSFIIITFVYSKKPFYMKKKFNKFVNVCIKYSYFCFVMIWYIISLIIILFIDVMKSSFNKFCQKK